MKIRAENQILRLLLVAVLLAGVSVAQVSLFSQDEPIAQLQFDNFSSVIHNSPKMWVVDFYASWCGYCQKLAPEFSSMAQSIQGWSDVVSAAVVACSDSINSALCRSYDVHNYPTIRLFPPNAEASFKGFRYEGDKYRNGLVTGVLNYLKQFVAQKKTDQSWPKLNSVRHPQSLSSSGAKNVYVVIENKAMASASVGLSVILDSLGLRPGVVVGRMNLSDAELYGITEPGLYESTSFGGLRQASSESDREKLSKLLQQASGVTTSPRTVTSVIFTYATAPSVSKSAGNVHMQDLESSLYYSFWVEIPSSERIDSESLEVLKKYVNLLDKYHPGEPHVKQFLSIINRWLSAHSGSLSAHAWLWKLKVAQSHSAYIRESLRWTGCNGSLPHLRGYPCSLWTTFHAVTVNAYNTEIGNADFNPKDVLIPIRDYVEKFFSCRQCAANFVRSARGLENENLAAGDVVLWLWKRHNRANYRLHGDISEDPLHPKIQFPSHEACPNCYVRFNAENRFNMTEDLWNEASVLSHLLRFYGREYIVDDDIEGFSSKVVRGVMTTVTPGPVSNITAVSSCSPVTTDWTPCSHTCDAGISMRMTMTSANGCRLEPEVRLCLVRPCTTQFPDWSKSRQHVANCPRHGHTYRLVKDVQMGYGNCTTTASESWRVCGKCPPSRGRPVCCRPSRSSTQPRQVTCATRDANGKARTVAGTMMVEVIDYCRCDNCDD